MCVFHSKAATHSDANPAIDSDPTSAGRSIQYPPMAFAVAGWLVVGYNVAQQQGVMNHD